MDVATLGIRVDASGAISVLDQFGNKVAAVEKKTDSFESKLRKVGAFLAAGWLGAKFLKETILAQEAVADLENAVSALGGGAGKTFKELDALSFSMQRTTRYSDEAAKSALTMLLTFNKIDGSQMERVAMIAADMSTRMGRDLVGAAQMVGRALQDPANGVTMIQKTFRLFNEEQLKTIELLARTGQGARAQEIIMDALEKKFKGAAAASRNTLGGALDYVRNTFGDLFEVTREGSSSVIVALNMLGRGFEKLAPHMSKVLAVTLAIVSAWIAYQAAAKLVVFWNTLMAAAQTIQAFISLALSIRKVADAMALLQLVGVNAIKGVIAIAALTVGFIAYKKVLEELNKEQEKFAAGMPGTGPAGGTPGADPNREKDFAASMAVRETAVRNELENQRELLKTFGQQTVAMEKTKNMQEAMMANAEALLRFNKKEIDEVEKERLMFHNERVRQDKDRIAEMKDMIDKIKPIWENLIRGLQTAFADFFVGVFEKGIRSFEDLARGVKDLFVRMIAELLASRVMSFILSAMSGGNGKSAATQQVSAAAVMLNAANLQAAAAATMARAAGVQATSAPSGGGASAVGGLGKWGTGVGIGIAGLGIGYGMGNSIGGKTGVMAGAASGAAMGAAIGSVVPGIGTAVGAFVGGVAGFIGGLFGSSAAAKRAREEQRRLEQAYKDFTNQVKVQLGLMTPLQASIEEVQKQFKEMMKTVGGQESLAAWEAMVKIFKDMGFNVKNEDAIRAKMQELNSLQQQRIQQLEQEAKFTRQMTKLDIEARAFEAQGQTKEAAALRLHIQHEREYADAVKSGLDAATLARLREVQAMEKAKAAQDAFTSSALNVPSGYKVAAAAFRAMDPLGTDEPTTTPGTRSKRPPRRGRRPESTGEAGEGSEGEGDLTMTLVLDGQVLGRGVVKNLRSKAAAQFGDPSKWAQVTVN